jgi:hypothetical protein
MPQIPGHSRQSCCTHGYWNGTWRSNTGRDASVYETVCRQLAASCLKRTRTEGPRQLMPARPQQQLRLGRRQRQLRLHWFWMATSSSQDLAWEPMLEPIWEEEEAGEEAGLKGCTYSIGRGEPRYSISIDCYVVNIFFSCLKHLILSFLVYSI